MTQNDILEVFGIQSSGEPKILRNDTEILEVIKEAYNLAKQFHKIYADAESEVMG